MIDGGTGFERAIYGALLAGALMWAGGARAQVDQQNVTGGQFTGNLTQVGQSFTPRLGSVDFATASLRVTNANQPANLFAEIRNGQGFGGALLGASNIVSVTSTNLETIRFSFATPINLAPGNGYTLRLAATSGTFATNFSSANPYAFGDYYNTNGVRGTGLDLVFSEGVAAEPGTWTLMIVGFGVVGGTMRRPKRVDSPRQTARAAA